MASIGKLASCQLPSVLTKAPDVPGAWVAECIPLGVITQGDSLQHAIEMLVDAVDLVVDHDLSRGVDPLQARRPIPGAAEEYAAMMAHPLREVEISQVDESVSTLLVMLNVVRPRVPAMSAGASNPTESRPSVGALLAAVA